LSFNLKEEVIEGDTLADEENVKNFS